jgi:hypothetical protein
MVHGEAMVLEQPTGKRHFVRRLNKTGAEVADAVFLVTRRIVEGRRDELLAKGLTGRETLHVLVALQSQHHFSRLCWNQQVVWHWLALPFGDSNEISVLLIKELPDCTLDLGCSQVLGRHRSRPGLLDDFL